MCHLPFTSRRKEKISDKIINNITFINTNYPNAKIILLGDFNPNIVYKTSDDYKHAKWLEQSTGLSQHIKGITRYSNNNSCIDLIFSNLTKNSSPGILDVHISDHQFIYISRKHLTKPKVKLDFLGRSYKNYDKAVFCERLNQLNWNLLYQCDSVDTAWDIMLLNIMNTIKDMCPLKKYKVAEAKEPWITNELLELIKDKDRLLRRAKIKQTQLDWELARNARNNVNFQNKTCQSQFCSRQLKSPYKEFKEMLAKYQRCPPKGRHQNSLPLTTNFSQKLTQPSKGISCPVGDLCRRFTEPNPKLS